MEMTKAYSNRKYLLIIYQLGCLSFAFNALSFIFILSIYHSYHNIYIHYKPIYSTTI